MMHESPITPSCRPGGAEIDGLPLSLTLEVCTDTLIRLRIGDVSVGAPSYLAPRDWPGARRTSSAGGRFRRRLA